MSSAPEYEIAEAALEAYSNNSEASVWPNANGRIRSARESLGLSWESVSHRVGEFYSPDIESYGDEVFSVPSVAEILALAEFLNTSLDFLLFGSPDARRAPTVSFADVIAKLNARIENELLTNEQLEDIVGWYTADYFNNPDLMITLPVFGLRDFCKAAGVGWLEVLPCTGRTG